MRRTTEDHPRGISSTLEDLDFVDDLALLSHTHSHIQEKTSLLSKYTHQVRLNISLTKTEVMTLNTSNPQAIKVNGEDLPMIKQFKYLGSIVRQDGGADIDIQSQLNKALNNVWQSSQYSTHTKLKIYHSCVLSTLLYGSECWQMLESDLGKLSTFLTKSLQKYFASSSKKDLQCKQEDMGTIIMQCRWRWIGHVI